MLFFTSVKYNVIFKRGRVYRCFVLKDSERLEALPGWILGLIFSFPVPLFLLH